MTLNAVGVETHIQCAPLGFGEKIIALVVTLALVIATPTRFQVADKGSRMSFEAFRGRSEEQVGQNAISQIARSYLK